MQFIIERASSDDRDAILDVMRVWNMHHVPSAEMEELDLSRFFVARLGSTGEVIGAAGYKMLGAGESKTTLLGVYPECSGAGVGRELQLARMRAMRDEGARRVVTNADRPETIVWYKKQFGYSQTGSVPKRCSFGLEDVEAWTTLELDLDEYFAAAPARDTARLTHLARHCPPPMSPYRPLIINACLTGMVPTRRSSPHVPLSVEDIVEDAARVHQAGAQIVHLHARDEDGLPTSDPRVYAQLVRSVREACPGLLCSVSTSGRGGADFAARSAVLSLSGKAKPDLASLTLGSLNFLSGPSITSITDVERLALLMAENGIKPEIEVFDIGMRNLATYLMRYGVVSERPCVNLIMGSINSAPATIGALSLLADGLPDDAVWFAAGLGGFQLPMNAAAIAAGGHVRVGLEDNLFYDYDRDIPASNTDLVERVARLSTELQRPLATSEQTRELLGIS